MRTVFWFATVLCLTVSVLVPAPAAQAPARMLSIDAIYDPDKRVDFSGAPQTSMRWLDDDTYLQTRRVSGGVEWTRVQAATGQTSLLFDPGRMESALVAAGMSKERAAQQARSGDLAFGRQWKSALMTSGGDLYAYDLESGTASRLTATEAVEEEATFSPDGKLVAFVRTNNVYVVDVATRTERALTADGNEQLLNGKLDWLYQEEIYGRGRFRGYWWSPDSTRVAFLQLDERPVPEYTIVDDIAYRPAVEVTDYPKAGDPNPLVKLGVVSVSGSDPVWIQLDYPSTEILVVDVDWVPDSRSVAFQVQDREQTWLDLNLGDPASGRRTRVLRETTPAWVNVNGSPIWLADSSFLWFSERSGFKHLYHYRLDGTLVRRVTDGQWDIRGFYGVDEARKRVFFDAGARRHIDTDIYGVGLDGANLTRLSRTDGTHRAIFNPSFTTYVGIRSDAMTPAQVRLHRAEDGSDIRVIDANPVASLAEHRIARPEFVEVRTRDGFVMDAMIIKPPDFDPSRRYPVYQFTYAGPGTSSVRNQWGGTTFMYHQLLAQHGVVVWILDNRSAGGKGAQSQWPVYGKLGELELQDLEDGISWLKQQPFVDPSRIVLHGWSYGGFMTAYALTHSKSWSAGIVGAPVTDWRNYDTVYTERFMKTPANNPEGYRRTAPRFAAANLHGRMLLIHGSIDDNVHRQNSEQFAYELQRAGKLFDVMIYPRSRHGITDARLNAHLRQTMFDFVLRSVGAASAVPVTSASQ